MRMNLARQRMYSMEVITVWILMSIEVYKMFNRRTKFRVFNTAWSLRKKTFYHPIMPSMTTLSDNKLQGILCTEHLRGLVLIKSSVKNITVAINKEKHFTNWCKEIMQGLMAFGDKTAGCSNSRRISHCLNRHQKGCRKNGSKLERKM